MAQKRVGVKQKKVVEEKTDESRILKGDELDESQMYNDCDLAGLKDQLQEMKVEGFQKALDYLQNKPGAASIQINSLKPIDELKNGLNLP